MADNTGTSGIEENVAALLSYVFWLVGGLVFYLIDTRKFVRFHAMQSILLSAVGLVVWLVSWVFLFIPFLGSLVTALLGLGMFVLWIILIIKAYQHEMYKLPIIGDLAEKYSSR